MVIPKMIDVDGGVLVAHDGSRDAAGALRMAVRIAAALEVPVTVARMWTLRTASRPDSATFGYMPPLEEFESQALVELDRDLVEVRRDYPELVIASTAVQGSPAAKLIEASDRVELIVVGRRGLGGFAGLLMGSVSEQVVRHSRCPVLVGKFAGSTADEPIESLAQEDRTKMEQALAGELKLE